jgi:hypothetical protein
LHPSTSLSNGSAVSHLRAMFPAFVLCIAVLFSNVCPASAHLRRGQVNHHTHYHSKTVSLSTRFLAGFNPAPLKGNRGTRSTGTTTTSPKYVVAHFIVGNAYPYTNNTWRNDISLAHAAGLDGFALNLGLDVWEADRVADA